MSLKRATTEIRPQMGMSDSRVVDDEGARVMESDLGCASWGQATKKKIAEATYQILQEDQARSARAETAPWANRFFSAWPSPCPGQHLERHVPCLQIKLTGTVSFSMRRISKRFSRWFLPWPTTADPAHPP